jgi:hypothetical protein
MPHKELGEPAIITRGTDFSSVHENARNRAHAAIFLTYVDRIRNLVTDWPGDGIPTHARLSPLPVFNFEFDTALFCIVHPAAGIESSIARSPMPPASVRASAFLNRDSFP